MTVKDRAFYDIKNRILDRWGAKLNQADIQHIFKPCWSCDHGIFRSKSNYSRSFEEQCWHCYGTGVYAEYWIILDRYKVGNYLFHKPTIKLTDLDGVNIFIYNNYIEGLIEHTAPKNNIGYEAYFWLLLFFNPRYFFRIEFWLYSHKWHWFTPLLAVNALILKVCRLYHKIKSEMFWRKFYKDNPDINPDDIPF